MKHTWLIVVLLGICLPVVGLAEEQVEVLRDPWGVPHVFASTEEAGFFGFGYATTEDRRLQMELVRRKGAGRLAEVCGPEWVQSDRESRITGYPAWSGEALLDVPSSRRPQYTGVERMAILQLRAMRGWNQSETSRHFLVSDDPIRDWLRRVDDDACTRRRSDGLRTRTGAHHRLAQRTPPSRDVGRQDAERGALLASGRQPTAALRATQKMATRFTLRGASCGH